MVVRRRKKHRKMLGAKRRHGYGFIGHRGKGNRGGVGRAGLWKHKKTWRIKYAPDMYGKYGFSRPRCLVREYNEITLARLSELIDKLVSKGELKEGDTLDLERFGYNKILGTGRVRVPFPIKIKVEAITEGARRKLEEAGCEVVTG